MAKKEDLKKSVEKSKGFINEFKQFISRGNVIDLAVGIIIGGAFTAIITSLVNDIITPLLGTIIGGINISGLSIAIPWSNDGLSIPIGLFLQSIINFILVAFCVFILIKVINKFMKKKEAPKEPPKPSDEVVLLKEIRDLLKQQSNKK